MCLARAHLECSPSCYYLVLCRGSYLRIREMEQNRRKAEMMKLEKGMLREQQRQAAKEWQMRGHERSEERAARSREIRGKRNDCKL